MLLTTVDCIIQWIEDVHFGVFEIWGKLLFQWFCLDKLPEKELSWQK